MHDVARDVEERSCEQRPFLIVEAHRRFIQIRFYRVARLVNCLSARRAFGLWWHIAEHLEEYEIGTDAFLARLDAGAAQGKAERP